MLAALRPLRILGEGGEGTVWLAWDPVLSRWLAVKVVRLAEGARGRGQELLASLAPVAREYLEPAVAPVLASGFTDALPAAVRERFGVKDGVALYIVLPYIHGLPANELAPRALGAPAVAALLAECTRLLTRLHAQGLVHLDVKPSNVLVDTQGRVWLVDLHLSTLGGTNGFAAPEQVSPGSGGGEAIGPAADWYALGRTLAALWSGDPPGGSGEPLPELPRPAVTLSGPERLAHEQLAERIEALAQPERGRRLVPTQEEADRLARDLGAPGPRQALARVLAASPARARLTEIEEAQGPFAAAAVASTEVRAASPFPGPRAKEAAGARRPRAASRWALAILLPTLAGAWFLWPRPKDTAARAASAAQPSGSCGIGEILNHDLVAFLCPGQKPRPGHGELLVRADGPSTGESKVELVENPGTPLWRVDRPPAGAGCRLELLGPHYYVSFTPTRSGMLPNPIYIDGKDRSKLPPEELANRSIPLLAINGQAELGPSIPAPDWSEIQRQEPPPASSRRTGPSTTPRSSSPAQ